VEIAMDIQQLADLIEELSLSQGFQVDPWAAVLQFLVAAALALVLERTYYTVVGPAASGRSKVTDQFLILTLGTVLVINAIQASIAIGLGFLGALSLIRFRSRPIEREHLLYLFLAVAVGLGVGAGQIPLTVAGFGFIVGLLWLRHKRRVTVPQRDSRLTITVKNPTAVQLSEIFEILSSNASDVRMRRVEQNVKILRASFEVTFTTIRQYDLSKAALYRLDESVTLTLEYRPDDLA
jgi:uncharacterized membrane protein YhiD involved in acid resistance